MGKATGANGQPPSGILDLKTALELFGLAGGLNSAMDLDFLLQKLGAAAEQLLDSEASAVLLVTDDKKRLFFKSATGAKASAVKALTVPIGSGICGWVAQQRKPEVVNDTRKDPRFAAEFDKASGYVTRSVIAVPMEFRGELVGVLEVLNRRRGSYTPDDVALLSSLASFASAAVANTRTIADQKNFFSHIMELLCLAAETTRPGMEGHSMRSARLACAIGRSLDMDDFDYRMLYYAGLLHDVGYVAFNSPETLAEMGVLKPVEELHPTLSVKLLEGIRMIDGALPMILHHHERYDGQGFPDRLAGEQIPLGARVLSLVEGVEELRMVGLRGHDLYAKAFQEVKDAAGRSFDPKVVEAFLGLIKVQTTAW
ncbi:MAG: GAF domain-containing protein [Elusimicrobia bacterium]|nr:GAF domain-containing protein [Elusimicrobiota bacterium]